MELREYTDREEEKPLSSLIWTWLNINTIIDIGDKYY
jgi:hypothetical protein